jgi:uncharacterized protein HemY
MIKTPCATLCFSRLEREPRAAKALAQALLELHEGPNQQKVKVFPFFLVLE